MAEFLYVFDEAARDTLLSIGMKMLKSDEKNKIYVFRSGGASSYAKLNSVDINYVESNTLTF